MSQGISASRVEYVANLESISDDETTVVGVRDLVRVHALLGELVRYFHQRSRYPLDVNVQRYMAPDGGGAYSQISDCYYKTLADMLPSHIHARIEEGDFDVHSEPYYFRPENIVGPDE